MLTDDQARLLKEWKLIPQRVLDARGMQRAEFLREATAQGKVAFAPHSPCVHGHVFWLGSGHCVQCRPQVLTSWRKYYEDGWVYIASSETLRLHKIGATTSPFERPRQLREGYGGAKDWLTTYRRQFRNHGRVEDGAKKALEPFKVRREYVHRGKLIDARELFSCNYQVVRDAIDAFGFQALGDGDEAGKILMRW